ncbi:GNAT family N-acetyltransferase (plasmid) [Streptomyces sp. NBC_01281]|uniref:GNAT family N-acetyltransferase n=1 Tax=Streptomyces sp. NBC_01281 TaxID=2903811 RepID=UPI002E11B817|nr:GNAT family N-acetyltransferase [Streptomyces sp. NBC_01281]WSK66584.1 GNAT family N-acetyltransferase [Streptomyces sp. NBC_01281]
MATPAPAPASASVVPHVRRRLRCTVAPLTATDHADYLALLALTADEDRLPAEAGHILTMPPQGPLSTHGPALCLTAHPRRGTDQQPVGALFASYPDWAVEHPLARRSPGLTERLARRALLVYGVAVAPEHRGQGIARLLLTEAEQRARAVGYRMTTLIHTPDLAPFYERLGYVTARHVTIAMPDAAMGLTQLWPYMTAVKPLVPGVRVRDLPGAPGPVVSALLPGWDLPADARFENGRLIS